MLTLIRRLCGAKGITIAGLERELKFGNGTVRGWATAVPQSDKLKRVADYFGITVDDLLRGDGQADQQEVG